MLRLYTTIIILFFTFNAWSQTDHRMTDAEKKDQPYYNSLRNDPPANAAITPPTSPVRTMAEWEELQALLIGWKTYTPMLREIVRAAKTQCKVMLLYDTPDNVTSITNYLASGGVDTLNV